MNAYFLTDQGKVRNHNEDAGGIFTNDDKQILALIADGMGGHNAGDIASEMVIAHMSKAWQKTSYFQYPEDTENWLSQTILEVNNKIFSYADKHEECNGMGTTVVAVICSNDFITIGHIGDSRCYVSNTQGLKQVTEDHSLVNELVRSGQISKADAEYHPRKNVLLKALGTELNVKADIKTIGWDKEDMVLLCSDGLTNKFQDEELLEYIRNEQPLSTKVKQLVDEANTRGGEDNISIAIVEYDDTLEEGES